MSTVERPPRAVAPVLSPIRTVVPPYPRPHAGEAGRTRIIEAVPMKKLGILVAGAIVLSSNAQAYDYKVGALEIDHPWSRAVPKGASVAAGYLTIRNTGAEPDRLVSGSTPVASKFIVHEMSMDKGIMK